MDAIPPYGGYWCFAERRYILDTKVECPLFITIIPAGAACDHLNMDECHLNCGHWCCPDCGLTWNDEVGFPQEQ